MIKHEKELNITLDKSVRKQPLIIGVNVPTSFAISEKKEVKDEKI